MEKHGNAKTVAITLQKEKGEEERLDIVRRIVERKLES
jgi:hypothetical protein